MLLEALIKRDPWNIATWQFEDNSHPTGVRTFQLSLISFEWDNLPQSWCDHILQHNWYKRYQYQKSESQIFSYKCFLWLWLFSKFKVEFKTLFGHFLYFQSWWITLPWGSNYFIWHDLIVFRAHLYPKIGIKKWCITFTGGILVEQNDFSYMILKHTSFRIYMLKIPKLCVCIYVCLSYVVHKLLECSFTKRSCVYLWKY